MSSRCRISIAVDSSLGLERLIDAMRRAGGSSRVRVLVDVNVGHARCGCTNVEDVLKLARSILQEPHFLEFGGIHCYHGSIQHVRNAQERAAAADQVAEKAKAVRDLLIEQVGSCPTVTGGGSGTFHSDLKNAHVWTELQPGSYMFGDCDYALNDWNSGQYPWEQALFVQAQVMSANNPTYVVIE